MSPVSHLNDPVSRLWNYNPYNTDERGDDWNGENFSWFSRRRASPLAELSFEQTSAGLDEGARILPAIVRPYPAKTAGIPLHFDYEMATGSLTFEWANPEEAGSGAAVSVPGSSSVSDPPRVLQYPLRSRETEIFMPAQLTRSRTVVVGGLQKGDRWFHDAEKQTVFIVTQDTTPGVKHKIVIFVLPSPRPAFIVNDVWSDYGLYIRSSMVVMLAVAFYFMRSFWWVPS